MKANVKKIACLVLSATMISSMAACGKKKSDSKAIKAAETLLDATVTLNEKKIKKLNKEVGVDEDSIEALQQICDNEVLAALYGKASYEIDEDSLKEKKSSASVDATIKMPDVEAAMEDSADADDLIEAIEDQKEKEYISFDVTIEFDVDDDEYTLANTDDYFEALFAPVDDIDPEFLVGILPEEPTTTTTEETTVMTTEPSTEATTEETTTEATSEDTTPVSVDGKTTYTMGDMTYQVAESWEYMDSGEYKYNFFDSANGSMTFLMFLSSSAHTSITAEEFEAGVPSMESEIVALLTDGVLTHSECHTDGPQFYEDIEATGSYSGYDCTMRCRIYLIPETGDMYYVVLFLDSNDIAKIDEIDQVYNDVLESATFA